MMMDQFKTGRFSSNREKHLRSLMLMNLLCVGVLLLCAGIFVFMSSSPSEANQLPTASVLTVEKEPPVRMVDVLIPDRRIDAGEQLLPTMFRTEPRPEHTIGERAVRDLAELNGMYARSLIQPGDPLSRDYMTSAKPTNIVVDSIPEGYRAVTINVDAKTGVEGWARPGARVDVAWTSNVLGKPGLTIIVQNALVLSAERNPNPKADPNAPVPSTISLMVSAKDAAKVQLAQVTGSITLSLRGGKDNGKDSGFADITVYDLLGRGNPDDGSGEQVEGFAKFHKNDGSSEEMVIINGQVLRRGPVS